MMTVAAVLVVLLGAAPGEAADIGGGFGEEALVLTSARQAGSGGVALEDPWRHGSVMDLSSVLLTSGMRWFGFGYQGGVGSLLRLGGEAFTFSPPKVRRTTENADGTYAGVGDEVGMAEYGGRITGQLSVLDTSGWRAAALGRVNALYQQLPESKNNGFAVEAGGQAQKMLGSGRYFTAWALVGPLGRGAARSFAGQVTGGVGLLGMRPSGFLGGSEGYALGGEGQWLTDGLMHGGVGGVYWFGGLNEPGFTFFLRAGVRYADRSAEEIQPRAGIGALWRSEDNWGVQFDYAVVPMGEMGMYHYATIGVRLPPAKPRSEPAPEPVQEVEPVEPAPIRVAPAPEPPKEEPVIYFYPDRSDKARVEVKVRTESELSADLMDQDGRFIMRLREPRTVKPGTYTIEWDGTLKYAVPAKAGVIYLIQIKADGGITYRQVMVLEGGSSTPSKAFEPGSGSKGETLYFNPGKGEKLKVPVEVRTPSILGAFLLDSDGRVLRLLREAEEAEPGTYTIEWDGTVEYGGPCRKGIPYYIRISANGETLFRTAVPMEGR